MNVCVLTGNLGADPESSYSSEGTPIASFNIAFKATKKKTAWIKVTCFNKLAEIAQAYLHKGAKIAVHGSIDQDKWESKSGEARSAFKLIANNIEFIKTDGRGFENGQNPEDVPF